MPKTGRGALAALLAAVFLALTPGVPPAAAAAGTSAGHSLRLAGAPLALPVAARGRSRSFGGTRSRARSAQRARRPINGRRLASNVLRALGIAYLFHLLFGIGSGGGSPIPLLLILGFVAFMVVRSRQRRRAYAAY